MGRNDGFDTSPAVIEDVDLVTQGGVVAVQTVDGDEDGEHGVTVNVGVGVGQMDVVGGNGLVVGLAGVVRATDSDDVIDGHGGAPFSMMKYMKNHVRNNITYTINNVKMAN